MRCIGAWLRLDPSNGGGGSLLSPGELQRSQVCQQRRIPASPGFHTWTYSTQSQTVRMQWHP